MSNLYLPFGYVRHILCLFLLLSCCLEAMAQERGNALELQPYLKFDKYPGFDDWFGSDNATKLNIRGTSWGLAALFKKSLFSNIESKIGIGFYQYTFNDVTNSNPSSGLETSGRPFDYPNLEKIASDYYTDNYHYNTFSFQLGADRVFPVKNGYEFLAGVNIVNYFSYAQIYKVIPARYGTFKLKDFQHFGISGYLNIGLNKYIGEFYIGGQVIVPIYDQWKQDALFREDQGDSRSKWLGGLGAAVVSGFRF